MTADRVWGMLFTILGLAMAFGSQTIAVNFPGSGDPGPRLVPIALGVSMAILGTVLTLRPTARASDELTARVSASSVEADTENPNEQVEAPAVWRRVALGLLFVAYVALFNTLGFSLGSVLFLAGAMILLGPLTPIEIIRKSAIALGLVLLLGWAMNFLLGLSVQGVWLV